MRLDAFFAGSIFGRIPTLSKQLLRSFKRLTYTSIYIYIFFFFLLKIIIGNGGVDTF